MEPAGLVAISDIAKADAIEVGARVKGAGVEPATKSGDNWRTADSDYENLTRNHSR